MLDFSFGELALIVMVAVLVVGPKDLPRVMHAVGKWFGQFKGISDEFKAGFRSAMHENHLHDLHKDLTEVHKDLKAVHEEVEYIRDQNGNLQRVYDIADFVDERDKSRVTVATTINVEKKSQ